MLISLCFNLLAEIPNTSSGRVVAIERRKRPIIIFGKFRSIARADAYFTT